MNPKGMPHTDSIPAPDVYLDPVFLDSSQEAVTTQQGLLHPPRLSLGHSQAVCRIAAEQGRLSGNHAAPHHNHICVYLCAVKASTLGRLPFKLSCTLHPACPDPCTMQASCQRGLWLQSGHTYAKAVCQSASFWIPLLHKLLVTSGQDMVGIG